LSFCKYVTIKDIETMYKEGNWYIKHINIESQLSWFRQNIKRILKLTIEYDITFDPIIENKFLKELSEIREN